MAIFTVVFSFFLKVPPPRGDPSGLHAFAFFLLCGLLPWNFLSNSLTGSMGALLSNANLIKKVYFPRQVLVGSVIAAAGFALLIELGVLAVALLIAGNFVLPWLVPLLLLVAVQAVFVAGVGLTFSVLNVYFRDVQHFVGILLQLWFYATPILYPITFVPTKHEFWGMTVPVRDIYELNPMVQFVEAYRDLLYDLRCALAHHRRLPGRRLGSKPGHRDGRVRPLRAPAGRGALIAPRRRVAVATPDTLTPRMAGPAIRAWNMAEVLSHEHDVSLVTTSTCRLTHPKFRVSAIDEPGVDELMAWCDVLVFQGFFANFHPSVLRSDKVLVADVYDPLHLEQLEQAREQERPGWIQTVHVANAVLNEQLLRADFALCASERQRDFWLGQLAGLGRVNPAVYEADETLRSLIDVAPFGLPGQPPVKGRQVLKGVMPGIGPDDEVVLWGGGIWNWFDPLTLIRAVDRLRRRRPQVRLFFLGTQHPNPEIGEMRMARDTRALADGLGLTGSHVFFNEGWVAYEDRHDFLLEADVGVSTNLDHVEAASRSGPVSSTTSGRPYPSC